VTPARAAYANQSSENPVSQPPAAYFHAYKSTPQYPNPASDDGEEDDERERTREHQIKLLENFRKEVKRETYKGLRGKMRRVKHWGRKYGPNVFQVVLVAGAITLIVCLCAL
jgi:hypothetical protein